MSSGGVIDMQPIGLAEFEPIEKNSSRRWRFLPAGTSLIKRRKRIPHLSPCSPPAGDNLPSLIIIIADGERKEAPNDQLK